MAKPEVTQSLHRTAYQLPLTAEPRQGHPSELAGDSPTSRIVAEGGGSCYSMPKICAKNLGQYLLINVGTNFPSRPFFADKKTLSSLYELLVYY